MIRPGSAEVRGSTVTFRGGTRYDLFVAPDGSKFAFVRTNSEFVSAGFELRGTAKRVGE